MIVLASASPRRRELLKLITPDFESETSLAEESLNVSDPQALVTKLAEKKALDVLSRRPEDTVIGADTIVWCSGEILGKPKDRSDAARMVSMLEGKSHDVYTGVCIVHKSGTHTFLEKTRVTFTPITKEEILSYAQSADVLDKAGAYAVQGEAAKYIARIDGCFYNVMGLPVSALYSRLKQLGKL